MRHVHHLSWLLFSSAKYLPGDLVTWMLPGNLPHIGIVSDRVEADAGRPLIIHNIGVGPAGDLYLDQRNVPDWQVRRGSACVPSGNS